MIAAAYAYTTDSSIPNLKGLLTMATYRFSQVNGALIDFNARVDNLHFDSGSAADLDITAAGSTLTFRLGSESVRLKVGQGGTLAQFTTSNFTFADGSVLLIGDNTADRSRDAGANDLRGSAGNDRLIGMGGNDFLDGRDGSDTYVVTGTGDGTDTYRDSGSSGVDRIVAGSNGT
ncbi:MAG: hypothetical protein ABL900_14770, partial [Burkholderiaceae bacterium]